jgi:hypothetical protein
VDRGEVRGRCYLSLLVIDLSVILIVLGNKFVKKDKKISKKC